MTNPTRYGTSCAPREDGVFVHFSEYEKVVVECERLRADAERYRWAIAYEDNTEALLAAVFNNAPDKEAISAEIDAERAKEQA
jgi:hypothetical protein